MRFTGLAAVQKRLEKADKLEISRAFRNFNDISAPAAALHVAGVAELVDARDLESRDESRGGSSPSARTSRAVSPEPGPITRAVYFGPQNGP